MTLLEKLQEQQKGIAVQIQWLHAHPQANLVEGGYFYGKDKIDYDDCSHEKTIRVLQAYGGDWEKSYDDTYVNYTRKELLDGVTIRCWHSEPPLSCKLVPYEEVIAAHMEPEKRIIKYRLDCGVEKTKGEVI